MRIPSVIILCIVFIFSLLSSYGDDKIKLERKSFVVDNEDGSSYWEEVTFERRPPFLLPINQKALLIYTKRCKEPFPIREKYECQIDVECLLTENRYYNDLIWKRKGIRAHTVSLRYFPSGILIFVDPGCCGGDDVMTVLNPKNGKEICRSTTPPGGIQIPYAERLLCLYNGPNAGNRDKDIILTYARLGEESRDLYSLHLKGKPKEQEYIFGIFSPRIKVEDHDQFHKARLEGLQFTLTWTSGMKTEFAIHEDKVHLIGSSEQMTLKKLTTEDFPPPP